METKSAKRFGDVATGLGFVTSSELDEALAVQIKEDIEQGSHRPIGQILFDLIARDALLDERLDRFARTAVVFFGLCPNR